MSIVAHYPTFGAYRHLLTERTDTELSAINDWYFENISKCCLLKGGFISFIRKHVDDTLYIKLYYVEDRVKENKREVEQFVSSFYLYEKYNLKYTTCNIIRIPLRSSIDETTIQELSNAKEAEALLQWQLTDDSWVGVDYLGTEGGLTLHAIPEKEQYDHTKNALLDGILNVCLENKIQRHSKNAGFTVIRKEKEGFNISVSKDQFILGWDPLIHGKLEHTVQFRWNGILFHLIGLANYGKQSNSIEAKLAYFSQSSQFGFGRSTIGTGAIGQAPNVIVGNKKLKFEFGHNWIAVSEIAVGPKLETSISKVNSSFELIF